MLSSCVNGLAQLGYNGCGLDNFHRARLRWAVLSSFWNDLARLRLAGLDLAELCLAEVDLAQLAWAGIYRARLERSWLSYVGLSRALLEWL